MTTLTVQIENENNLPVFKEILTRFGLNYKVSGELALNTKYEKLYKQRKKSFSEIKDWEANKIKLRDADEAIKEIEAELDNGI